MLAAALAIAVTAGPALVGIPDEPGAQVVLEAAIYQAVAADLDGDGSREIVVLTHGDGSAIAAAAWRDTAAGWRRVGEPIEVLPGATIPGVAWLGSPMRLLVRSVDGVDRVTLVRQPAYRDANEGPACCLLIDDLVLGPAGVRLVPVAATRLSVEAVHVLDLDGDGTDELVATTSVPPLGDTSFPTDARVYRWSDGRFTVTDTRLPIGSGDTPFLLGDSDGRPGEELAIIATAGRQDVYRVSLGSGDSLVAEAAGMVAFDAAAVPIDDGRGIAVLTTAGSLAVRPWPFGAVPGPAVGEVPMEGGTILGTVGLAGVDSLILRQTIGGDRVHVFDLPALEPRIAAITPSPAAAAFDAGPLVSYVGALPGGLADGSPAIVYAGRLLGDGQAASPFATLGAAQPIGLVGSERAQLALLHGPDAAAVPLDPRGGRLDAPRLLEAAAVTVAPMELVRQSEHDDAGLDPTATSAVLVGPQNSVLVGPSGFIARVDAPPGSRVYVAVEEPDAVSASAAVPPSGSVRISVPAPRTPGAGQRAALAVTTPAGRSYLATWDVRLLADAPPLAVLVATPIGSGEVEVTGRSATYATISVDGQPVAVDEQGRFSVRLPAPPWPTEFAVTATDPFGNVSSTTATGVGWFDYRSLPWIPIAAGALALAGVFLFLRVPRASPLPRRADDDAGLEELGPD